MSSGMHRALTVSPPEELVMLRVEPQVFCYFGLRNVTLAVWVGQATLPSLHVMGTVSREMVRQHPEGHSSIVFILDRIPAPSPEASELISRAFNTRSGLVCVAVVVEGTGFWGSAMRSMMGNARRAVEGESRALLRLHSTIDEVVAWLPDEHLRRTGVQLEAEPLRNALRWVREHGAAQALNAPRQG